MFRAYFLVPKRLGIFDGDKSSSVEQVYNSQALQDGELAECDSVSAQGRLHGHNRFKRCLFFDSNSPVSSKISSFQLEEPAVPVCCSSVWPYQCSTSIHESFETGHSKYATKGNPMSNLYRRPDYCGIFKDMECNEQARVCSSVVNRSRFQCKYGKIKLSAENSSGVPRVCVGFDKNGAFSTREEERGHSTKNSKLTHEQTNFSSSNFKYGRLDAVGQVGSNASGYLLPISSTGFEQCSRRNRERLRLVDNVKSRSSAGAKDVVNKLGNVARQSNGDVASKFDNSDRCLPVRMGAVCLNTGKETNGLWSKEETMLHINVLELMTAWFAIQTLVNVTTGAHVRFQMDNTTAVSYINKQGGTKSCQMVIIAKKIWDWAIKHQVQVSAEHLPGKQNVTANKLSRELNDNLEWSLDREVFCKLIRKAGFRPQVDLFATRLNAQVQKFVSWKPDPQAWKVDAFAITWTGIKAYAFPPFCLISRLLQKYT